VQHHFSENG
jgi:hypothetical protein